MLLPVHQETAVDNRVALPLQLTDKLDKRHLGTLRPGKKRIHQQWYRKKQPVHAVKVRPKGGSVNVPQANGNSRCTAP